MNADDIELLRELDARKSSQMASLMRIVEADDALISALFATYGEDITARMAVCKSERVRHAALVAEHGLWDKEG